MEPEWEISKISYYAAWFLLVIANLVLIAYLIRRALPRKPAGQIKKLRRPVGNGPRRVLLMMAVIHYLGRRTGYVVPLLALWFITSAGSMLLRLLALGLMTGGLVLHRMSLSHPALVQRMIDAHQQGRIEAGTAPLMKRAQSQPDPIWRYSKPDRPREWITPWEAVLMLIVINGLLGLWLWY
jgi:hypothetical protein